MESEADRGWCGQTLVMVLRVGEQGRALTKWRRNGRAPELVKCLLQQPLRSETCDWVDYRQCLPSEYPAGHREAYRRIAQMHDLHKASSQSGPTFTFRGGTTSFLSEE